MTGSEQLARDVPATFGKLRLAMFAITLAGVALATLFAIQLTERIGDMREVPRDNLQWNTAQLEVDFLKMRNALREAQEDPQDLGAFRKQYDIFYSRVKVVEGGTQTLPIDGVHDMRADLERMNDFLVQTVDLVDSEDAVLMAGLSAIDARLDAVNEAARQFALGTVQVMADISDGQRTEIVEVLRRLALVTLFVIGALAVSLAAMTRQRIQLLKQSAAIAQAGRVRETTLRASLDAIVVIDASGRITDFNGSAEEIFGFARHEIIGQRLSDTIVPHVHREAHAEGFARYTAPETSSIVDKGRLELTALHKDGHTFPIELSISETPGADGPNFVSYIRDITEEKLAKAELQQARDDALSAFQEKSHFFAVMSHEMRTPLNGIMSALNLIRDEPMSVRQERYVGIAESCSKVLLSHIDDVLLIERLDSDENTVSLTTFRPAEIIDELVETMRPIANQQNTRILVDHGDPGIGVYGQCRALQQIVMNLVSNAIKFTPSGRVMITTRIRPETDDMVTLTATVADTGIGMSESDQARIFEDFVTVDSPYERTAAGTGLGLGIVRRLVRQMGGEVTCNSRPGEGSTFQVTVTLPRVAAAPVVQTAPAQSMPQTAIQPLSVLVVEDNPINAEVLQAMLARDGHRTSLARDGFEGVHMASREFFDVILMDVSMPNMNGIKATQELRASRGLSKDTPIFAVTAHAMPKQTEEFIAAGMTGCLLKPIRPDALRDLLGRIAQTREVEGEDVSSDPGSGEKAVAESDLLDAVRMAEVAELLGPQMFDRKLTELREQSDRAMIEIDAAREAGDLGELERHAHKLAGSCGVFGVNGLHDELQSLVALCQAGERHAVHAATKRAAATWQATRKLLRNHEGA